MSYTCIPLLILHTKARGVEVRLFQRGVIEREMRLEDQDIVPVQLTNGRMYAFCILFPDGQVLQRTWELEGQEECHSALQKGGEVEASVDPCQDKRWSTVPLSYERQVTPGSAPKPFL